MPKTDLKISSTSATSGQKITTSISYVNPEATSAVMLELSQRLNSFTTNVYDETNLVKTYNIDSETIKKQPTLYYETNSERVDATTCRIPFTYTGDGELHIFTKNEKVTSLTISKSTGYITMQHVEGATGLIVTYCMATETNNCYSCALVRSIAIP